MHASVPYSKLNTDGDYGTSRKIPTRETLPPEPDVSLSQPTNINLKSDITPSLLIPPPTDFSSDIPVALASVPPPLPLQTTTVVPSPSTLQTTTSSIQPNYIFINNINEFGGLPAAIRTANYIRPDRTSENLSEAFFDKSSWLESDKNKLPTLPKYQTDKKSDPSSLRYHLSSSEVQNISNANETGMPEQRVETQYDLILEKESDECIDEVPPPLPKTPPPPLTDPTPISVAKYFNLLTANAPSKPEPPPKPTPVTHTNTHAAGVSDESKWKVFSNAFSQKVIEY